MDTSFLFRLEPGLRSFRQLPCPLLDQEILRQQLARGIVQSGEHRLVHHGLATLGEVDRLPAIQVDQSICDVIARGWIELDGLGAWHRDALLVALRLVVPCWDKVGELDDPGSKVILEFSLQLPPALHQLGIEDRSLLGVEVEAIAFLLRHQPSYLMLKLKCKL